jgi:hypothetical protein
MQFTRHNFAKKNRPAQYLLVAVLFSLLFVRLAQAVESEGAAEKPADKSAASPATIGPDREWAQRTSKLNVQEAKQKDLTKQLQKFIIMKNENRAPLDEKGKPIDLLASIAETHKKLKGVVEEYNADKNELRYRYPEQGTWIERKYLPMRDKSIDEIEHEMGLDGELTKTKRKIDQKYAPFVGDEFKKPDLTKQQPMAESTLKELKPKPGANGESERLKLSQ